MVIYLWNSYARTQVLSENARNFYIVALISRDAETTHKKRNNILYKFIFIHYLLTSRNPFHIINFIRHCLIYIYLSYKIITLEWVN